LGVQQIAAGLEHLFDIDSGVQTQVILIAGVTAIATVSVVLGVDKGLDLSEWNMRIAFFLIVVILGPTIFIFFQLRTKHWKLHIWFFCKLQLGQKVILDLIGKMLDRLLLGMGLLGLLCRYVYCSYFKRRTVREFILGVLLVPSIVTFF
jgi:choline/glycine/proline betaine transport protein